MSDNKVVPFRRKQTKPSPVEIATYRMMTRNWSDQLRQLMFPMLFDLDSKSGRAETK